MLINFGFVAFNAQANFPSTAALELQSLQETTDKLHAEIEDVRSSQIEINTAEVNSVVYDLFTKTCLASLC